MRATAILILAWASSAVGGMNETSTDYNRLFTKFQAAGGELTKFGPLTSKFIGHVFTDQSLFTTSGWVIHNHVDFDAGEHVAVVAVGPNGERVDLPGNIRATAASGDGRWIFLDSADSENGPGFNPTVAFDAGAYKSLGFGEYLIQVLKVPAVDLPKDLLDASSFLGSNAKGDAVLGRYSGRYFLALGDAVSAGGPRSVPEPTTLATFAFVFACAVIRRVAVCKGA